MATKDQGDLRLCPVTGQLSLAPISGPGGEGSSWAHIPFSGPRGARMALAGASAPHKIPGFPGRGAGPIPRSAPSVPQPAPGRFTTHRKVITEPRIASRTGLIRYGLRPRGSWRDPRTAPPRHPVHPAIVPVPAGLGDLDMPGVLMDRLRDQAASRGGMQVTGMVQHPVVRLREGTVLGKAESGVLAFLGIPYAAPPFGANRMLPPQPVRAWDGERDATGYGPTAPKGDYPPQYAPLFPEVVIPGEDCLNVNVWTPDTTATGLPVLVWIHGGSFMNGSGSVGAYNGAAFARDGVVCVTINYRLSAEGFLFLDDGIANLGLLDQLAALRWVQANISAFGGDPARVTVAGESAGAMSVTTLLAMPLAEGLFTQAIAQSGAAAHTLTQDEARMVGGYLADALGVPAEREAIKAVPLDKLVQAASDLVAEVQTAPDPAKWGQLALSLLPFAPAVDGTVVPQAPLAAIAAGQGSDVRLLIGSNRDEARLFLVAAATIDLIDDATLNAAAAAYRLPAEHVAVYRANRPGASAGDILAAVVTRLVLRHPIHPGRRSPRPTRKRQHLDLPVRPPRTRRQPPARCLPRGGDPLRVRHHHPQRSPPPHRPHAIASRGRPNAQGMGRLHHHRRPRLGPLRHHQPRHQPDLRPHHRRRGPSRRRTLAAGRPPHSGPWPPFARRSGPGCHSAGSPLFSR